MKYKETKMDMTVDMATRLYEQTQSPTVCEDGKPSYYYFEDLEEL